MQRPLYRAGESGRRRLHRGGRPATDAARDCCCGEGEWHALHNCCFPSRRVWVLADRVPAGCSVVVAHLDGSNCWTVVRSGLTREQVLAVDPRAVFIEPGPPFECAPDCDDARCTPRADCDCCLFADVSRPCGYPGGENTTVCCTYGQRFRVRFYGTRREVFRTWGSSSSICCPMTAETVTNTAWDETYEYRVVPGCTYERECLNRFVTVVTRGFTSDQSPGGPLCGTRNPPFESINNYRCDEGGQSAVGWNFSVSPAGGLIYGDVRNLSLTTCHSDVEPRPCNFSCRQTTTVNGIEHVSHERSAEAGCFEGRLTLRELYHRDFVVGDDQHLCNDYEIGQEVVSNFQITVNEECARSPCSGPDRRGPRDEPPALGTGDLL